MVKKRSLQFYIFNHNVTFTTWGRVEISLLPLKSHIAYTRACCYRTSRDIVNVAQFLCDSIVHTI